MIIFIHEAGHYIAAKKSGLIVTDAFIGFGPTLWSFTKNETRYGIKLFLLGGFVRIPGMSSEEKLPEGIEEERTYRNTTYKNKVLVVSAGVICNFVLSVILAWLAFSVIGVVSPSIVTVQNLHWVDNSGKEISLNYFHKNDTVLNIAGNLIHSQNEFMTDIVQKPHSNLPVTIKRENKIIKLNRLPFPNQGKLHAVLGEGVIRYNPIVAFPHAVWLVYYMGEQTITHLSSGASNTWHALVSPQVHSNSSINTGRFVSIIGIVRLSNQAIHTSFILFLFILILLNIMLAILNIMPFPFLDGWYLAIATYERLRSSKETNYHIKIQKLYPFIAVFVTLLIITVSAIAYLDVTKPLINPFK